MGNERLRSAMARARIGPARLAEAAGVDTKSVRRWLGGTTPHPRHRWAVADLLDEDESYLWPLADSSGNGGAAPEIVAAYAHRVDVPAQTWAVLMDGAREQVNILGYSFLFLPEQHADLPRLISGKAGRGCVIRIAVADPACGHVTERDALEGLDGTLPSRIRTTLTFLRRLQGVAGVEVRLHTVHLYSATYRYDDQMIVTPYLYRRRGFQHPALHLRRLGGAGVFAAYAQQFEDIWGEARPLYAEEPSHGTR
ncbi:MAG: DUF5919 domain-containing protein [Micromonosporaceae bacterium]